MSELSAPSYRVQRPSSGGGFPWRMIIVATAILGAMGVGALAVWGLTRAVSNSVPTIEADARPLRVKPEDPGGMRVANQGERIFETQNQPGRRGASQAPAQSQVAPESEKPNLDALRQATIAARQAAQQAQVQAQQPQVPAANPSIPGNASAAPQAAPPPVASAGPAATMPSGPAATMPSGPAATAPSAVPATPPAAAPARPAPVAARTPEPAASRAAEGSAVVQLGALGSEEAARGEWNRLRARLGDLLSGRQPQVIRFEREGQPTMWRLRTGGFRDHEAAKTFCDAARAKGAPACAAIGG